MNKKYLYIGNEKLPLELLKNAKCDELSVGGIMIKKNFLITIDKISKPMRYNLLDYIKKELDRGYLKDKTNRHYCEIKNPYAPKTEGILKSKYISLRGVEYSVMIVSKNGKVGLIDQYCNTILPIENDDIYPTLLSTRPYLVVTHGNISYIFHVLKYQIISKIYDKIEIASPRYYLAQTTNEYFKVYKNGKCGLIHEQGKEIVPPIYDDCKGSLWFINNDERHKYIIVTLNNKKGILNELGEIIAEIKYDEIQFSFPTEANAKNLEAKGWIDSEEFILIESGADRNKRERKISSYDQPSYERYRGTYAQDEMGYNDDEIDTIFDGDPDAYWNID